MMKYKAGDIALQHGNTNDRLFRIRKGCFTVSRGADVVAVLRDGDMFGEMSLCGSNQHVCATIRAMQVWIQRVVYSII